MTEGSSEPPDPTPRRARSAPGELVGSGAGGSMRLVNLRPSRLQWVFLVLISILSLGPLAGLLVLADGSDAPVDQLIEPTVAPESGVAVQLTITEVDPLRGEVSIRLQLQPSPELMSSGRLTESLRLYVNDLRGDVTHTFRNDEPLRSVEAHVALTDGSVTRYPIDRYGTSALVALALDETDEPVPVTVGVASNVDGFNVEVGDAPMEPAAIALVALQLERSLTTTIYALAIMVLMWGFALSGVLIVWAITIWRAELPIWVFGYFVGVLFALPPLRASLPGTPPPGTLLDFVAFYWALGLVGLTLLLVVGIWVSQSRQRARTDAGPVEDVRRERDA